MATYYLSSVDGDDGSDGLSWDNAFATYKFAVETASAAASGPHLLYVDSAHSESLSADTTATAAGDIRILCVNRAGGNALATGAVVGAQATNYAITFNGAFNVYTRGITFQTGTNTNTTKNIIFNNSDGGQFEFENCTVVHNQTATTTSRVDIGAVATGNNLFTRLVSCTFTLKGANHTIRPCSRVVLENCDTGGSTNNTNLFVCLTTAVGSNVEAMGCDFSTCTSNLVGDFVGGGTASFVFMNCKIGSGVSILAAATTVTNKGQTTVTAYNCNSGDAHYSFYHGDALGSTTAMPTYWADDGIPTASTALSYKIVTTANCSFFTPYVGPWIAKAHTGTSAITPHFEGLRVDSTTVIQNDEVWGEWLYQGTSGSTKATIVNDRMTPLGSAADQTSTLAYSNWSGSPTDTDNADSAFKLLSGSITPAEVGCVYGRVVVGEPSLTVYYDPQIRGT